jgi:hypothetical protein
MSGGNIVFNVALGKVGYYAELPGANDALILIPIEAAGLESDATLKDYDTVAAILAAANNEQTTLGRKTLASVTSAVNDTDNKRYADAADGSWVAGTGNAIAKVIIAYDPDTTGGSDTDLIPLTAHSFDKTPDGTDIPFQIDSLGFYDAG